MTKTSIDNLVPILIAGPTASGKSALALQLAEKYDGIIINADSMQVYAVLQIITARPQLDELKAAPHRLYGYVPPDAPYSVARWQNAALAEIAQAQEAGKRPILVGGTGLYFTRLTTGLVKVPHIAPDIRETLRARKQREGNAPLYEELTQLDPVLAARLPPSDSQRILRGLEVALATGTPLSAWQKQAAPPFLSKYHGIVLMPDRQWLYERCNARFEQMLAAGAVDEVKTLLALNIAATKPAMKAHGVPELAAYLHGTDTLEEATARAQQITRRYAKRQLTWYRNQMPHWAKFSEQDYNNNIHKIFSFISK